MNREDQRGMTIMRTPHPFARPHKPTQATLLLDGPLDKKLGGIADVNALVTQVAQLASASNHA